MEREIDKHERVQPLKSNRLNQTKIDMWRKAWMKCMSSIEQIENSDLENLYYVLGRWIPILNKSFDSPLSHLDKYQIIMYCYDHQNGPQEIIQFHVDDSPNPENLKYTYMIFNANEFNKVLKFILNCLGGRNNMYVDEARGTINIFDSTTRFGSKGQHAVYHKKRIIRYLLFIYTLHALAHLHIYSIYKHGHYDNHKYLTSSPFFKLYYSGYMAR